MEKGCDLSKVTELVSYYSEYVMLFLGITLIFMNLISIAE